MIFETMAFKLPGIISIEIPQHKLQSIQMSQIWKEELFFNSKELKWPYVLDFL